MLRSSTDFCLRNRGSMPNPKEWGIYVYFAADVPSPAMRRGAKLNLLKLADIGSNDRVGITALMDQPDQDTQLYVIPPQPEGKDEWLVHPSQSVPNVNTASTDTIRDFFEWSVANCPAKKIAFVFWGHGYAIDDFDPRLEPTGVSPAPVQAAQFVENGHMERGDDSPSDEGFFVAEASADQFAGSRDFPLKLIFDSSYNAVLNNDQVGESVRACRNSLPEGSSLTILGFDCCNMAMAEVLCEMQDCADIAVAAETGLPFRSWISENVLEKFLTDAPRSPEVFAQTAIEDFVQSFAYQSSIFVALSACNLALCNDLEAAAKRLAAALTEAAGNDANRGAIFKARNDCVCFDPDGFIDFDCFCGFLSEDLAGTAVAEASLLVRKVLKRFVIASAFAPNFPDRRISLSTGLSIWFPSWIQNPAVQFPQKEQSIEYFWNGYHRTRFARATGWARFLLRLIDETDVEVQGG